MATKEIKTKIALRYLDYNTWSAEAFQTEKPLKGEVWFCEVPTGNTNATTAPTMLFKVGDGVNNFGALKWASALAADVYEWAKQANLPVERADGKNEDGTDKVAGNVISSIYWENDKIKYTTASVATSEGMAAITKDIADNREAWAQNDNTTYQFSIPTNGDDKGKLVIEKKEIDGTEWTEVGVYDFVTPGELSEILADYYTKGEVDELIQGVENIVNSLDESITTVTEDTGISVSDTGIGNDHVYTVALNVEGAKTALGIQDAAYTTVEALNTTAKGYADGVQDNLTAYENAHASDYTNTKIDELIQGAKSYANDNDANTEYHVEYDSSKKKIKLVAGADANKMEIDATAFIKDGMIESVELVTEDDDGNKGQFLKITWNTDGDVDNDDVTYVNVTTLVDVYIGENGDYVNVTVTSNNKIKADLTKETKEKLEKTWEEVGVAAGLDATLKAELQKEIDDDIVAYDTGKGFGDIITHNAAEFATNAENGAKALAQVVKNVVDANKETWDKAGTALQASDLTAYDTTKNFGDIITHNAAEFATSAQGGKADTALQNVEVGTGLKVANKKTGEGEGAVEDATRKVIDIDDSVVFILNCNY